MEARLVRAALLAASLLSLGASYRTENFIVTAPSERMAREVAESSEAYRRDLAIEWLGRELPPWRDKCPITVHVGPQLGAGGVTQFMFERGQPFGWSMTIQGSRERVLDSVLPHEITHTIFATHFGRPLPRWADEGACTTVEHVSEKSKQHRLLYEFLTTGRGIAFNRMFAMTEYPPDVLPLYSQGFSLARFLIGHGGKRKFIDYIGDGMKSNNWPRSTQKHYGFKDLSELQITWLDWVRDGSRPIRAAETLVTGGENSEQRLATAAATRDAAPDPAESDEPIATVAASTSAETGWYARVRDTTTADPRGRSPADARGRRAGVRSASRSAAAGQAVSRPQPMGRAQQVILEWSRPDRPAKTAVPGQSYLVSPETLKGTILR